MFFIDRLTLFSIISIIRFTNAKDVHILNPYNNTLSTLIVILNAIGYKVKQAKFFFGDFKESSGQSMFMSTRKEACELAFNYSKIVCKRLNLIENYKNIEDNLALQSYISKLIYNESEYYLQRINYIKEVSKSNKNIVLLLQKPKYIDEDFIKNYSDFKIKFYGFNLSSIIKQQLKLFLLELLSVINTKIIKQKKLSYNTTISIATDTIDIESSNRHFPHWLNKKNFKDFIIINKNNRVNLADNYMQKNRISILDKWAIPYLPNKKNKLKIKRQNLIKKNLAIRIKKFYSLSNGILYLLKKNNCSKAIFTDAQDPIIDAVILCKKNHSIETFCIQYSNLPFPTPLNISPVDNYLIFSKHYEKIFQWDNIVPKNFIETGYTFSNLLKYESLKNLKDNLNSIGVNKVISFFDESIQYTNWGMISFDHAKSEYEFLARFILSNNDYAILIKSKFVKNSLSIFNSKIIKRAMQTNRLIELKEGDHRNEILPYQLGKISDHAISNYVGGTAGIEAALAGSNVFFMNPYKLIHDLDDIFLKHKVVFDNLEDIFNRGIYKKNYSLNVRSFLKEIINSKTSIQEILC